MDTNIEHHYFILTHRTDLKDRVWEEPQVPDVREEPPVPDKSDIQITAHPVQRASGKLKDIGGSGFILEHVKYGDILVDTSKKLFRGDEKSLNTLRDALGKQVDIALDKTGTRLSVTIENGPTLEQRFQSPGIPYGLMDLERVARWRNGRNDSYKGELAVVYGGSVVELKTKKGPLMVIGHGGASSEATLKKMIGKQVVVNAGYNDELVVKNLEHEKSLAR